MILGWEAIRIDAYMMWLSRVDGVGAVKLNVLINRFGSAKDVYKASRSELRMSGVLTEQNVQSIQMSRDDNLIEKYIRELEAKNIRFVSFFDDDYPTALKEIHAPPLGLYVIGQFPDKSLPRLGIIGSRRCSEYGLSVSHKLGMDLASVGIVIVSGMARGIDSMAHRGAIEADGFTIAVLGCGVDICYPPENRALRENIILNGCLVSEYPPLSKPLASHFPARNRIISGMSTGIIVVEAAKQSGTIITTDHALEQGREVMAVPGPITSKLSYGTNELIKSGATPVTCREDVIECLRLETLPREARDESASKDIILPALARDEKVVYDCINQEPVTGDEIIRSVGGDQSTVAYILTILEINGYIQRLPGQRFIRTRNTITR